MSEAAVFAGEFWEENLEVQGDGVLRVRYRSDRGYTHFMLEFRSGKDWGEVALPVQEAKEAGAALASMLADENIKDGHRLELDSTASPEDAFFCSLDVSYHRPHSPSGAGGFFLTYACWDGDGAERCNLWIERGTAKRLAEKLLWKPASHRR